MILLRIVLLYLVSLIQGWLFTFSFGQNLFSSYDFTPDIIEANNIMVDVLLKRQKRCSLSNRAYALKATQWVLPS